MGCTHEHAYKVAPDHLSTEVPQIKDSTGAQTDETSEKKGVVIPRGIYELQGDCGDAF